MFYIRAALAVLGFMIACSYGVLIAIFRRDRSRVAHDTGQMLVRLTRPPLGLSVRVTGREHVLAQRPCIYLANHQSIYDVPVLAELYPPDTVVIGKKELRRIPLFGWLFAITGNILINRSDNPGSVDRLREVETAVLDGGKSVWIFPEGTRGIERGRLLPFKKGAFYMAIATEAPLVPIIVEPFDRLYDLGRRRLVPGTVEVHVLPPVSTRGLTDADVPALLESVQERMQAELDALAG